MFLLTPPPALRPFVDALWASDDAVRSSEAPRDRPARERVLPTGGMHMAFFLAGPSLRMFRDVGDLDGYAVSDAIVGGARSSFYVRGARGSSSTVGVQFRPGAASRLLGVDADELAERHTPLEELWGRAARELHEKLAEASSAERRLERLEAELLARLDRLRREHDCVALALSRFERGDRVDEVVRESGLSHRRFLQLFRRSVGLPPKVHCRVQRLRRALAAAATGRHRSWCSVAQAAGYADQPHFNREFRELAGLSPGEYRALAPIGSHHVPLQALSG